jgi:hypothetical protein
MLMIKRNKKYDRDKKLFVQVIGTRRLDEAHCAQFPAEWQVVGGPLTVTLIATPI